MKLYSEEIILNFLQSILVDEHSFVHFLFNCSKITLINHQDHETITIKANYKNIFLKSLKASFVVLMNYIDNGLDEYQSELNLGVTRTTYQIVENHLINLLDACKEPVLKAIKEVLICHQSLFSINKTFKELFIWFSIGRLYHVHNPTYEKIFTRDRELLCMNALNKERLKDVIIKSNCRLLIVDNKLLKFNLLYLSLIKINFIDSLETIQTSSRTEQSNGYLSSTTFESPSFAKEGDSRVVDESIVESEVEQSNKQSNNYMSSSDELLNTSSQSLSTIAIMNETSDSIQMTDSIELRNKFVSPLNSTFNGKVTSKSKEVTKPSDCEIDDFLTQLIDSSNGDISFYNSNLPLGTMSMESDEQDVMDAEACKLNDAKFISGIKDVFSSISSNEQRTVTPSMEGSTIIKQKRKATMPNDAQLDKNSFHQKNLFSKSLANISSSITSTRTLNAPSHTFEVLPTPMLYDFVLHTVGKMITESTPSSRNDSNSQMNESNQLMLLCTFNIMLRKFLFFI